MIVDLLASWSDPSRDHRRRNAPDEPRVGPSSRYPYRGDPSECVLHSIRHFQQPQTGSQRKGPSTAQRSGLIESKNAEPWREAYRSNPHPGWSRKRQR
jgi:hypothetical protein